MSNVHSSHLSSKPCAKDEGRDCVNRMTSGACEVYLDPAIARADEFGLCRAWKKACDPNKCAFVQDNGAGEVPTCTMTGGDCVPCVA